MKVFSDNLLWMEETTDVTPIDVAEYRRYLLERCKPATIDLQKISSLGFCGSSS
jgi:hypothetical protein